MTHSLRPTFIISSLFWIGMTIYGGYFLYTLKNRINFGIDLVGGTYLTLDVKVEEAVKNELLGAMQRLVDEVQKDQPNFKAVPTVNEKQAVGSLVFESPIAASNALKLFLDFGNQEVKVQQDGNALKFAISGQQLKRLQEETVEGNIAILHTRLDAYGAGEVGVIPLGSRNIGIELPNVSDPAGAKNRIGKAALLELKPVYDFAYTKKELLDKHNGQEPEGTIIIPSKKGGQETGYFLVPNYAKITGRLLRDASYFVKQDDFFSQQGSPHAVQIQFKSEGAQKFFDLTRNHVNQQIAIVIDNVVISAPVVNSPIDGGVASITGSFSEEEAKELVAMLKSGAFAAPVEFIEERHIGPSLGSESIHKGFVSCGIGLGLLFIFSIIVYKVAGLFAFIVLLYNLLFILIGLALIPHATLTLPGIAGMVLTVGMAIDSSILIYERIKEELAQGVPMRKAVEAGFAGALTVILDANITTLIVGAVLYYFGSPAIQGFALTMIIGIFATLLTGLWLLRWFFDVCFDVFNVQKIRI